MVDVSHAPFFLFGCAGRTKLICTVKGLFQLFDGKPVCEFEAETFLVDAAAYSVEITCRDRTRILIGEDEEGIWLDRRGSRTPVDRVAVALPRFEGHPYRALLRKLYHEILVNIHQGAPLPNIVVYHKPWYRDAAMVCMVLERCGSLHLVRDWILGLRAPYDRLNGGNEESDNLGQLLYLASLASGKRHPIVSTVMAAARLITRNHMLGGSTDFAEHPVYQNKWIKFGLASLGLPDPYIVPQVSDSYAPLVWWARDDIAADPSVRFHTQADKYPYLTWAEAHFWNDPPPFHLSNQDGYPLTWEASASQADYEKFNAVDRALTAAKCCMPHTWHAAEMFLFLHETPRSKLL
jgi:hypothetical protein